MLQTLEAIDAVVFPGADDAVRQSARGEFVRRVVIESGIQTCVVAELREAVPDCRFAGARSN